MKLTTINIKYTGILLSAVLTACGTPSIPPAVTPIAVPQIVMPAPAYAVSKWEMLPDWRTLNLSTSHLAFLQSCKALKTRPNWRDVCARAEQLSVSDNTVLRAFWCSR